MIQSRIQKQGYSQRSINGTHKGIVKDKVKGTVNGTVNGTVKDTFQVQSMVQ